MLQLFLFGFAVDTNIRQIPTGGAGRIAYAGEPAAAGGVRGIRRFSVKSLCAFAGSLYEAVRSAKARVGISKHMLTST